MGDDACGLTFNDSINNWLPCPAPAIRLTNKDTTLETSGSEDDNGNPSPAVSFRSIPIRSADDESLPTTTALYDSGPPSARSVLGGFPIIRKVHGNIRRCHGGVQDRLR